MISAIVCRRQSRVATARSLLCQILMAFALPLGHLGGARSVEQRPHSCPTMRPPPGACFMSSTCVFVAGRLRPPFCLWERQFRVVGARLKRDHGLEIPGNLMNVSC